MPDESATTAPELTARTDHLSRRAAELAERLVEVDRTRDNQRKKFLHRLRRLEIDVQQNWVSQDPVWNADLLIFRDDLQSHRRQTKEYLDNLARVCERRQAAALEIFRAPGPLGVSLNFVSPDLARAVGRHDAPTLIGKKDRKIARGLGKILVRSTTKSSPFALLNDVTVVGASSMGPRTVTALTPNTVHQLCVFEALALSDELIDQVRFRLNPNSWNDGVSVHVVGQAIDVANRKVFRHRDCLTRTKLNGPILAALHAGSEALEVSYLQRRLGLDAGEARTAMRTMVDLGLLSLDEHLTERLDGIAALLERMGRFELPTDGPVTDTITDLRAMDSLWNQLSDEYSTGLHYEYLSHFVRINERWGIKGFDSRDALLLDRVSASDKGECLARHQVEDLEALLQLAPAFDVNTLIQQEVLWRLGGRDKLTQQDLTNNSFFHILTEANLSYAAYWSDPFKEFDSECPTVNALQVAKREFANLLCSRYTVGQTAEIEVLSEDVSILRDLLPDGIDADGYVYSVFGQNCPDGTLVINNFYPGRMSFMRRFTRHLELGEDMRSRISEFYARDGEVPLEIYETMGFNANVYKPECSERLLFDTSRDRSDGGWFTRQVPLSACRLAPRGAGIGLKDEDGTLRTPILASSLIRVLYPGQVAFFSALFDNISFITGIAGLFLDESGVGGIVESPRVRFRSLVLERRLWLLREPASTEFKAALGSPEAPLSMATWLRNHGLPYRFYLQVRRPEFAGRVHNVALEFRKPQFFDVDDLWMIQLARSEVIGAVEILVSEELPDAYAPELMTEVMVLAPDRENVS